MMGAPASAPATPVVRHYLWKFFFRLAVFLLIAGLYLWNQDSLDFFRQGMLSPAGVLWLCVLISMLAQINSRSHLTAGCMKQFPNRFESVPGYDPSQLRQAVRRQNRGALKVLVLWLAISLTLGLGYRFGALCVPDLVLLCALCYLCDLVCVLFFCPFQFFLMGNRCCVNCRIFAWGAWMMAAPLMLVPHFYAQSLSLTGAVVLIVWEIRYHRHPERFWSGSNRTLQCSRCQEKLCRFKNRLYRINL